MIDILFHIINTSIVIAIFVYLFRAYLKPQLIKERAQHKIDEKKLHEQYYKLQHDERDLLQHAYQTHKQYEHIREMVEKWRGVVSSRNDAAVTEQHKLTEKFFSKQKMQQERQALRRQRLQILQNALGAIEQSVKTELAQNPEYQKEYIQRVVVAMEKEV